jgi:hypothetical protein
MNKGMENFRPRINEPAIANQNSVAANEPLRVKGWGIPGWDQRTGRRKYQNSVAVKERLTNKGTENLRLEDQRPPVVE